MLFIFFFKQKTAYELRISDWSSDVCSSDLSAEVAKRELAHAATHDGLTGLPNRSAATEWLGAELADASDSGDPAVLFIRSEERRVGKECVRTCRSRWSRHH